MSSSCPGMYSGSILFSGKSMTKWYQGPELPPSCRCWRLKLKITTLCTLEVGCPRAVELYPKENSWMLLQWTLQGWNRKQPQLLVKSFFSWLLWHGISPTFCIGIFSNLRVRMLLKKEYTGLLISHFGRSNKRLLNPHSLSFATVTKWENCT